MSDFGFLMGLGDCHYPGPGLCVITGGKWDSAHKCAVVYCSHGGKPPRPAGCAQLFEIGTGVASLLGVTVEDDSQVAGMRIREISMPNECVVAAVIRGKDFVVPRGDTHIKAGDRVIFVGPTAAIKGAQKFFNISKHS